MKQAYALAAMALAASAGTALTSVKVEGETPTPQPREGKHKRKYLAGPFVAPWKEPQREDYPSRQAWRAEHRRWSEAQ